VSSLTQKILLKDEEANGVIWHNKMQQQAD
jgi:hypothetical protein